MTFRELGESRRLDDFRALTRLVAARDRGNALQTEAELRRRLMANVDGIARWYGRGPTRFTSDKRMVTYQRPIDKLLYWDEDLDPQLMDREQTIVIEEDITVDLPVFLNRRNPEDGTIQCKKPSGTEMFEFEDKFTRNADMPDNLVYHAQGTQSLRHPWIDVKLGHRQRRRMDAVDFRERCVQRNGRNHAIYMKTKPDCQPAQHRRPEWLAEQLPDADWNDVMTITECFRKLSIDRPTALKLIHGCLMANKKLSKGLKSGTPGQLGKWAAMLEGICEKLPTLSDERLDFDGYRSLYANISEGIHFDSTFEQMQWIEESAREYHDVGAETVNPRDVDKLIEFGFVVEEPEMFEWCQAYRQWQDQTLSDEPFDTNPFSTFALRYGEDNIPYEIVYEIKTAPFEDVTEKRGKKTVVVQAGLRTIAQRMYRQDGQPRAEYEWMNYEQRSQFWRYYNERRQSLAREYRRRMSRPAKEILKMVTQLDGAPMTKALIYAYQNGTTFEGETMLLKFEVWERPTAEEVYVLWAEYNRLPA